MFVTTFWGALTNVYAGLEFELDKRESKDLVLLDNVSKCFLGTPLVQKLSEIFLVEDKNHYYDLKE